MQPVHFPQSRSQLVYIQIFFLLRIVNQDIFDAYPGQTDFLISIDQTIMVAHFMAKVVVQISAIVNLVAEFRWAKITVSFLGYEAPLRRGFYPSTNFFTSAK